MRVVIVHSEFGIYLGSCMGMGFWSKLDPAGQDSAVTFKDATEAESVIKSWDNPLSENSVSFVCVNTEEQYATVQQCVEAGLPAWNPDAVPEVT